MVGRREASTAVRVGDGQGGGEGQGVVAGVPRELDEPWPARLAAAHGALDPAVWAAYGWADAEPSPVEEDAILGRLIALNQERGGQGAVGSQPGAAER